MRSLVLFAMLKTPVVVEGPLPSASLTQTIGRRIQLDGLRRCRRCWKSAEQLRTNEPRVLRTVIVVAVIMVVLELGAFDRRLARLERGANLVGNLISVAVILIVPLGIWLGLRLIEHKLNPETGHGELSVPKRC